MKKKIILASVVSACLALMLVGFVLVTLRFPIRYLDIIEEHSLDTAFVLSVIHAESTFRPHVVSHRGAIGLMQIMESTGQDMANRMGFYDFDYSALLIPESNIAIGIFYLNWLEQYFGDDRTLILSGYNAGPGRVRQWLADERFSQDGITLSYIPFPETRNYINRVKRNYIIYTWLLRLHSLF
ncbi:MAG: lytic transglycosylase domain-containing protein [Turicibacter sp.]|nr:lytic transglycosylase domain-containing protein [Turicibacter sp.]